jgi:hypothetical protein
VALGWLTPYTVGHYWLEVANDVFNDMGTSGLVILPSRNGSIAWYRAVGLLGTIAVPEEWSIGPTLHCSRMSACLADINCTICPHVLQAHDGPDVRRLRNMRMCIRNMQA